MLVVMLVAAVVLFAFGAGKATGLLTQHTDTQTRTFAAAPIIVVSAESGDVKIVATDRSDVRLITKEQRSVWGGGHGDVNGDAAGLRLDDRCDGLPVVDDPCGVSYRLEVPRATAVRVSSGTGDLSAENLDSTTELRTATGDLHVTGVSGTLRLHADTGDVHVDAPARDISVQTATGDIEIVATHPASIQARADTGDIVFVVPDLTYAVDAQSDVGDDQVVVRRDDASPRKLQAHTSTGNVVVSP
jgi:Putative adhesin